MTTILFSFLNLTSLYLSEKLYPVCKGKLFPHSGRETEIKLIHSHYCLFMNTSLKSDNFRTSVNLLFYLFTFTGICIFLFGEFLTNGKTHTGIELLSSKDFYHLKNIFLYGILLLGGTLIGLFSSKSANRLFAVILQVSFFLLYIFLAPPFQAYSLGWGFKLCFLFTAINFILILAFFICEKNKSGEKNWGISVLLTLCFGPLGLFYATKKGALLMLITSFIILIIHMGINTFVIKNILYGGPADYLRYLSDLNVFVLLFIYLTCTVWGIIAVGRYNQLLLTESEKEN